MASETFVSAMMLITAVVASAILITAVFPVVWTMVSTFSSASHETDTRMRTDFKIVTTYANHTASGGVARIWMKNIGTNSIGITEIQNCDILIGLSSNFNRASTLVAPGTVNSNGKWTFILIEGSTTTNNKWDNGETLEVDAFSSLFTLSGQTAYFQFILPNGASRSSEFTTS